MLQSATHPGNNSVISSSKSASDAYSSNYYSSNKYANDDYSNNNYNIDDTIGELSNNTNSIANTSAPPSTLYHKRRQQQHCITQQLHRHCLLQNVSTAASHNAAAIAIHNKLHSKQQQLYQLQQQHNYSSKSSGASNSNCIDSSDTRRNVSNNTHISANTHLHRKRSRTDLPHLPASSVIGRGSKVWLPQVCLLSLDLKRKAGVYTSANKQPLAATPGSLAGDSS